MTQPVANIGTIGHVDHGKTSLVAALTGKWTDTHSEEVKRGITIKLGYADAIIYKCPSCKEPDSYSTLEKCAYCGSKTVEQRKVSFVDAPGHETLMATVIAASSIIDGALFVIAATEKCPQPQTAEHLMVLEAAGVKHVVVAQNKIDLVSKEQAIEHYQQIKEFLKGSHIEDAEIVPTAAHSPSSLNALISAIERGIPTPKRDLSQEPLLFVARSFDVNKPGSAISKIAGGVVGGSLVRGKLKPGDVIEFAPGLMKKRKDKEIYEKIETKIVSLNASGEKLSEAVPGGLIGVGTSLDPALTRADALVGNVLCLKGKLPPVRSELLLEITALKRAAEAFVAAPGINEPLVLGIGTNTTVGFIEEKRKKAYFVKLKKPVAANNGEKLAVMRRAKNRWHLYGTATILQ